MNKWILSGILSFAVAGLCAHAEDAAANTAKKEHKAPKPCPYVKLLEKYDANKDGKLDDAEKAKMGEKEKVLFEKIMTKYDANKDGVLDDTEKAAMKADMAKKKECGKKKDKAPETPAAPAVPAA